MLTFKSAFKTGFSLILCLLLACLAVAQQRLTPEILWSMGRLSDEQVSPDGKKVLYGVTTYNVENNSSIRTLFEQDITGTSKKRLTPDDMKGYNARWRPDGKVIGFLSPIRGSMQLFEINPDGSNLRQVTDYDFDIFNFDYSPNQKHISFTKNVKLDKTTADIYPDLPESSARIIDDLMFRHWDSWHDYTYSHIFYAPYENGNISGKPVDIMEGELFDSPQQPFGGPEDITWSPDGRLIVYVSKKKQGKDYAKSTDSDIYIYNVENGRTINITEGMDGYDTHPVFSPDGKVLSWLSMARAGFEADKNILYLYNMESSEKLPLTKNVDISVSGQHWNTKGDELFFIAGVDATYQIYKLSVGSEKMSEMTPAEPELITDGIHNINSFHIAGRNGLVYHKNSMTYPADLYYFDLKNKEEKQITAVNQKILDDLQTGKVEKRMVKTTDGKDMLVWVIYPPDFDPNKRYPTLLYCQGGPQSAVSQFYSYRWNFQIMAANDYIVVAPNRRGLPTFGQEWNDEISGDWGGQPMDDYLSAIDDLAKEDYVDQSRLGAVGASYGGYSVYYLAGIHKGRFQAFISHCGLYNMVSWYASTEELFFANWDLKGPYWKTPVPKSYTEFSPHNFVDNWDTPILVIHGEKDFRVPINQGIEAFTAAKLRGLDTKFLYFPDEGHWVLKPQNGILWQREFFKWLDKYLK